MKVKLEATLVVAVEGGGAVQIKIAISAGWYLIKIVVDQNSRLDL